MREHCNPNSHLIYHGIELDRFTPEVAARLRRPQLQDRAQRARRCCAAVAELPYVELRCTDGKLSDADIPGFYQDIDYVLITSSIEGGPLCFQEGLASGKEILSTDVGMVSEFRDAPGVHVFADARELFAVARAKLAGRTRLRANVERFSVDYWVTEHDKLFRRLITGVNMTQRQARSTIALSTRTLGQATGVSQAALDVLLSLSRTGSDSRARLGSEQLAARGRRLLARAMSVRTPAAARSGSEHRAR